MYFVFIPGEKPYPCRFCGRRFRTNYNKLSHEKKCPDRHARALLNEQQAAATGGMGRGGQQAAAAGSGRGGSNGNGAVAAAGAGPAASAASGQEFR